MILIGDGDAGHDVIQKDLQGSGEVGLVLQVTGLGGDDWVLVSPSTSNRTENIEIMFTENEAYY